ncbi:uncharacterized protein LDX57_002621 [Aspergillus melleus]|uniref:uncharacterized protein n=1 Tax=Aspergillus melleus TaxID=138277 RepID=UPI001E8CAC61|nr:uncharacterized protein LDX57_002621 [Aspergillus melleus]KAH8424877.1 hypothetical protein LDX57_002621 [Aspergillus melleus]
MPSSNKSERTVGIETVKLDTLSESSLRQCVASVTKLTSGSLDALINNAGAGYSMPGSDMDIGRARELFELNVWSLVAVTQALLPLLLASTCDQGALLVNHGSLSGVVAASGPFAGAYNASKAAVMSFTETWRLELEPFNIRVIDLVTGAVRSNFHITAEPPELPVNSLYNVAKEAVENAMASDDANESTDPEEWAKGVVKELSKRSPPYWIWAGKFANIVRLASLLPLGIFDRFMKRMCALDVVERNLSTGKGRGQRPQSSLMAGVDDQKI